MKKTTSLLIALMTLAWWPSALQAEGTSPDGSQPKKTWAQKHPRRAQVNHRERKQVKNTKQDVKDGKITAAQGHELNKEDRQVRQEERDMASQNGGHITKEEQKTLNSQETAIRKQRSADIKSDAGNVSVGQ